jgi:hypothetical protein
MGRYAVASTCRWRVDAGAADTAMRAYVLGKAPSAVLPRAQHAYCPAGELRGPPDTAIGQGMAVFCIAEYHAGTTWGSVAADLEVVRNSIRIQPYWDKTWTRRWALCLPPPPRHWLVGGTLISNNDCGANAYGGDDWYFASQLYATLSMNANGFGTAFRFDPAHETAWDWTDSAGYALGAYYRTATHGGWYTYSDVVGDSFRYRPCTAAVRPCAAPRGS